MVNIAMGVLPIRDRGSDLLMDAKRLVDEFLAFLQVRVALGDSVSPSAVVDDVWHKFLLKTSVQAEVYRLVNDGEAVCHDYEDEELLTDDSKMVRRLVAMNKMHAVVGRKPDIRLWREAGTIMANIVHVDWRDCPTIKYMPADISCANMSLLLKAMGLVCEGKRSTKRSREVVAIMENMRYIDNFRNSYREQVVADPSKITVTIKELNGNTFSANCRGDMTAKQIKRFIEKTQGICVDQQRLIFSSRQFNDCDTLEEYGVVDGSTLHLVLRMRGC